MEIMVDWSKLPLKIRKNVAREITDADFLMAISDDEDEFVRRGVASNSHTSPEVLEKLSDDYAYFVVCAVASNPNTSINTLKKLIHKKSRNIRMHVIKNKNATEEICYPLCWDKSLTVRAYLAKETESPSILQELFDNYEERDPKQIVVLREIASNVNTPPSLLEKISKQQDFLSKVRVAKNPNTSAKTLQRLAKELN